MKKLISILLLLAIVFTLAACRKKDNDKNDNDDNTSQGGNPNTDKPKNPFESGGGIETPIIPLD